MTYLIYAFVGFAFLHFIYEGIIAPSLRLEVRFKLFQLRDDLRMLKIEHAEKLDDRHFHYLQDSINNVIRGLPNFSLAMLYDLMERISKDRELKARLDARAKILDDCQIEQARKIREQGVRLVQQALSINSGGWWFYILPIVVAVVCYASTKNLIRSIASLSEPDFQKVVSDTGLVSA